MGSSPTGCTKNVFLRPHRLSARTQGSHPWKSGPTPLGGAIRKTTLLGPHRLSARTQGSHPWKSGPTPLGGAIRRGGRAWLNAHDSKSCVPQGTGGHGRKAMLFAFWSIGNRSLSTDITGLHKKPPSRLEGGLCELWDVASLEVGLRRLSDRTEGEGDRSLGLGIRRKAEDEAEGKNQDGKGDQNAGDRQHPEDKAA